VRVDAERQLLLIKGSVPGSRGRDIVVRPTTKATRVKGPSPKAAPSKATPGAAKAAAAPAARLHLRRGQGDLMELKLINEQGKSAASVAASDALFGREFNESLVHQIVVAYRRTPAAVPARKRAQRRPPLAQEALRQKGHGACALPATLRAAVARRRQDLPEFAGRELLAQVNRKMYRAGMCSILSQLAREERLKLVESFSVEAPKTKLLRRS